MILFLYLNIVNRKFLKLKRMDLPAFSNKLIRWMKSEQIGRSMLEWINKSVRYSIGWNTIYYRLSSQSKLITVHVSNTVSMNFWNKQRVSCRMSFRTYSTFIYIPPCLWLDNTFFVVACICISLLVVYLDWPTSGKNIV